MTWLSPYEGMTEPYRRMAEQVDALTRQRDALQRVLEPLLKSREDKCVFCGVTTLFGGRMHRSDCPALPANRDRLLGRYRAPAPPEATG